MATCTTSSIRWRSRYAPELNKKAALIDYAQGAPFLESYYKSDFLLLATRVPDQGRREPAGAPGQARRRWWTRRSVRVTS